MGECGNCKKNFPMANMLYDAYVSKLVCSKCYKASRIVKEQRTLKLDRNR